MRESCRVACLWITPLRTRSMDIEQLVITPARRELHPAGGATKGDIDGGAAGAVRRAIKVRCARPIEGILAVSKSGRLEDRINGGPTAGGSTHHRRAGIVHQALQFLGVG